MERRFTVVLHADIAGYARLMDLDEEGTHKRLRHLRATFWDPVIAPHGGRVANTAGDSLLVEFETVKVGLECAIEVQIGMQSRNRDLDPDRYIALRIGVHHGRVFSERGGGAGPARRRFRVHGRVIWAPGKQVNRLADVLQPVLAGVDEYLPEIAIRGIPQGP